MSAFKNDQTIPYGSEALSIGTLVPGSPATISGGVSYIADNMTFETPAKTIERTNELDEPTGQVSYIGFVTGSATLQLATTSTAVPTQGQHFLSNNRTGTNEVYYIESLSQPFSKDAETKVNINFRKAYNTAA